ncbi:MAG: FliH/SctL family protein [Nitrospinales bacterium]
MSSVNPKDFVRSATFSEEEVRSASSMDYKPLQFTRASNLKKIEAPEFQHYSDDARNLDKTNIKKAQEGVKKVLQDAVDKAKKQAVRIKEEARKQGLEEGFAEGFAKGEQAAREEFAPFLNMLQKLVLDLSGFRREMYPKVEREMVEMALALAKKVIHHELNARADGVKEMILLGVQSVLDKEKLVIKVHPADKGYAESFSSELRQTFEGIRNLVIEATPAMERGGCVIETNFGSVDARLENLDEQIDKILDLAPAAFQENNPESSNE